MAADIAHTTTLKLSDLSAAYVLRFGGGGVRPYVGAGGGLLWWQLREEGSFIDFSDEENLPIVYASYLGDGVTWELFALAGIVPEDAAAELATQLGDDGLARALERGRRMTLDEAVDFIEQRVDTLES